MKVLYKRSKYYKIIERHISRVPAKLKELDEGYFVLFNARTKKFEVHNSKQRQSTYSFEVPFDELDYRTVRYARETAVHRGDEIVAKIEESEKRKEDESDKKYADMFEEKATDLAEALSGRIQVRMSWYYKK